MDVILCATRGGEASIKTQERAIEIAKERSARLVFLFVSDVRFLEGFTAPRIPAMEDEMEHLGEFLLIMAKERARKADVEADTMVCSGAFRAALLEAAQEVGASLIVLGRPAANNLTTLEFLQDHVAADVRAQTGIEIIVV